MRAIPLTIGLRRAAAPAAGAGIAGCPAFALACHDTPIRIVPPEPVQPRCESISCLARIENFASLRDALPFCGKEA
jgi:hypothetical protein